MQPLDRTGGNAAVEAGGVRIEPEAGGWRIEVPAAGKSAEQPACSVLLLDADAPGAGQRLLHALAQQPLKLAALQEAGAPAIASLLPKTPPWQPAEGSPRSRCSCAGESCGHAAQAANLGAAAWRAASPEQRLSLLGWTRATLLAAVLAAWAEAKPLPDAAEALRAALGPRKEEARPRTGGPSIAEWLAEMAEQGGLHAPGPQFHDVQIRLDNVESSPPSPATPAHAAAGSRSDAPMVSAAQASSGKCSAAGAAASGTRAPTGEGVPSNIAAPSGAPAASRAKARAGTASTDAPAPAAAPNAEALAELLPGVRGAAKGLGLVVEGAMQRAEELARQLRNKPR